MIEPSQRPRRELTRYPSHLLRRVAEQTGFSYRLSALDLSNDGGVLAVELARLARTVTLSLDDPRAFAAASENVQRNQARVQLRQGGVSQLVADGARYWLVTIGRHLHARDGARLLADLDTLVERGGAVAVLGSRYPRLPENDWRFALEPAPAELVHDLDEGLLLDSAFARVERVSVFERSTLTVEQAVAELRPADAERARAELRAHVSADDLLHQLVEGHALIARREGDRGGRWS
ncbi:MAG: hypothetical protein ABW352_01640 [Polyangiales bacterium]